MKKGKKGVQVDSEPKVQKQDRKFKKTSSISKMLKCSICLDVFYEPSRLFCGHTYCFDCLQSWNKSNKTCPICREPIDSRNIGKDLLAYNMTNELQVFCVHDDCSWEGPLELLNFHVFYQCLYHQLQQQGMKKNKAPPKAVIDEQVEEKINQNVVRGNLISRVMMKDQSFKYGRSFDMARKIIENENVHSPQPKRANIFSQTISEAKKEVLPTNDDIDFLMELYENSK